MLHTNKIANILFYFNPIMKSCHSNKKPWFSSGHVTDDVITLDVTWEAILWQIAITSNKPRSFQLIVPSPPLHFLGYNRKTSCHCNFICRLRLQRTHYWIKLCLPLNPLPFISIFMCFQSFFMCVFVFLVNAVDFQGTIRSFSSSTKQKRNIFV